MQPLTLALCLALALPPAAHEHNERAMDLDEAGHLDEAAVALEAAYAAMPDPIADLDGREQVLASLRSVLLRRHQQTATPAPLCRLRDHLRTHVDALQTALATTPDRIELSGNRERLAEVDNQLRAYPPEACDPKPAPPTPEISSQNSSPSASNFKQPIPTTNNSWNAVQSQNTHQAQSESINQSSGAPSPKSLRIAGGITVGLGAALLGVMTYALVQQHRRLTDARAIERDTTGRKITRDEYDALLDHRARAHNNQLLALGTGISAALTTGLGVALLVMGRKQQPRRVALAPWWLSSGTGVSLTLRLR
jgi:hypothetical protein